MIRIFLISFLFVSIPSLIYAAPVKYYDPVRNLEIEDVSGKKPLQQIKKEFGDADYQVLKLEEGELYKIDNKTLRKLTSEELTELKEEKDIQNIIQEEMDKIIKKQAIKKLKEEGKLPVDYPND